MGDCLLCADKCRGHSLGHPEQWEPEPGSAAYRLEHEEPAFTVAARYSDMIKDGRTQGGVLAHMRGEVEELDEEIVLSANGKAAGPDGIFGEAVDIMACCADIIRREYPDMPLADLEAMVAAKMREKCEKWLRGVEAGKYADREART